MLKTNSKKAKENLKDYITNSMIHYDETPCRDFTDAAYTTNHHFINEKMYPYNVELIRTGRATKYQIFKDWMQGLPLGSIGDYYYNVSAIDLLGDILEETEEERNRFSEEQAQEKLTQLIYNAIFY